MNVLLLKAWLRENGTSLIGARLKNAEQLDPRSFVLNLLSDYGPIRLLVSVLEEFPVMGILEEDIDLEVDAGTESNFVKAVNFHLPGYRLVSIEQRGFDRSVIFTFKQRDMYGQEKLKVLRHELVGRSSNAFLLSDRNMVVSIFKRVRRDRNRLRQIITGKTLPEPPPVGKYIAAEGGAEGLSDLLAQLAGRESPETEGELEHLFTNHIAGCDLKLWPDLEPMLPVEYDIDSLYEFIKLMQRGDFTDQLFGLGTGGDDANDIALDLWQGARLKRGFKPVKPDLTVERLGIRLDQLQSQRRLSDRADEVEQLGLAMLAEAEGIDGTSKVNDYILDWQGRYPDWAESVTPAKSVYDNSQALIQYAQRLRRGRDKLDRMIIQTEEEMELMIQGSAKTKPAKPLADPVKPHSSRLDKFGVKYMRFVSTDGFHILCGLNDRSNDGLIRVFGNGKHLWLHARDYPGSHVIILNAGRQVPHTTLEQAAVIAGYHSQGKEELQLDISYLLMKHLRRPRDGKPGQVLKMQEKVITIRPQGFPSIKRLVTYKPDS